MKGISTILATILIVIIVVALVSLTYTFAIGLFGTASTAATGGVEETTKRIDKGVAFVTTPICSYSAPTYSLSFTIRHLGATYKINQTEVSVFFGNDKFTITTGTWSIGTLLEPGSTISIIAQNSSAMSSRTDTVTVSAPAASITKTNVICP
jgi:FlaG/FlaF family flagellin (archaellin)